MARLMRVPRLLALSFLLLALVGLSDCSKLSYKRRIADLRSWNNDGLVAFDDNLLDQYIFVSPRNYSLFLFLGASEQQCQPCRQVEQTIAQLSRAYRDARPDHSFNTSDVFFGRVMYEDAHYAFQNLGVKAVPALLYIKPSTKEGDDTGPVSTARYPFKDVAAVSAQDFYAWMRNVAELPAIDIPLSDAPVEFMTYFLIGLALIFVVQGASIGWKHRKNPMAWYYVCLAIIFIVYAGTVFNAIHSPPPFYIHPRTGQLMLIYPSMRQQFVVEGVLVAFLIVSASGLWVLLTTWAPEITHAGDRTRALTICGLGLLLVLNLLFKFFALKNYGYPYRFFLF